MRERLGDQKFIYCWSYHSKTFLLDWWFTLVHNSGGVLSHSQQCVSCYDKHITNIPCWLIRNSCSLWFTIMSALLSMESYMEIPALDNDFDKCVITHYFWEHTIRCSKLLEGAWYKLTEMRPAQWVTLHNILHGWVYTTSKPIYVRDMWFIDCSLFTQCRCVAGTWKSQAHVEMLCASNVVSNYTNNEYTDYFTQANSDC